MQNMWVPKTKRLLAALQKTGWFHREEKETSVRIQFHTDFAVRIYGTCEPHL